MIFAPLLALALAWLRRRRIVLIQHEWGGLHWLRRITYMPALMLADTIVMFSPLVQRELAEDPLLGWTARKCVLAPLPPNIEAPAGIADSKLRQRLAAAQADGRLVIGHFGSIYPGKQPNALLEIGAILKQRGLKPLIVYIGSFIRGVDKVEEEFHARVAELDLAGRRHRQPASSPPITRCSACSARSTRSAIRSMKASPRGAPAFSPARKPAGR